MSRWFWFGSAMLVAGCAVRPAPRRRIEIPAPQKPSAAAPAGPAFLLRLDGFQAEDLARWAASSGPVALAGFGSAWRSLLADATSSRLVAQRAWEPVGSFYSDVPPNFHRWAGLDQLRWQIAMGRALLMRATGAEPRFFLNRQPGLDSAAVKEIRRAGYPTILDLSSEVTGRLEDVLVIGLRDSEALRVVFTSAAIPLPGFSSSLADLVEETQRSPLPRLRDTATVPAEPPAAAEIREAARALAFYRDSGKADPNRLDQAQEELAVLCEARWLRPDLSAEEQAWFRATLDTFYFLVGKPRPLRGPQPPPIALGPSADLTGELRFPAAAVAEYFGLRRTPLGWRFEIRLSTPAVLNWDWYMDINAVEGVGASRLSEPLEVALYPEDAWEYRLSVRGTSATLSASSGDAQTRLLWQGVRQAAQMVPFWSDFVEVPDAPAEILRGSPFQWGHLVVVFPPENPQEAVDLKTGGRLAGWAAGSAKGPPPRMARSSLRSAGGSGLQVSPP